MEPERIRSVKVVVDACLTPEEAALLAAGDLTSSERRPMLAHVALCDACRDHVVDLAALATSTRDGGPDHGPAPVLRVGQQLGRYRLGRRVGAGGMGVVWAAHDEVLGRRVALKFLRTSAPGAMQRLREEGRALGRVDDPGVVTLFDVGMAAGRPYLAMRYVDGLTLDRWARSVEDWRRRLPVCLAIGRALAAAHDAGVVHGDVKPANILVDADGRAALTDFGLATVSAPSGGLASTVGGTHGFIAPELYAGDDPSEASDQYALARTIRAVLGEDAPSRIRAVLQRGEHPESSGRFRSVQALLGALERAASPRHARVALASALAGILGALAVLGLSMGSPRAASPRGPALITSSPAVVHAQTLLVRGVIARRTSSLADARAHLRQAWADAEAAGATKTATLAQLELLELLGSDLERAEEALAIAPFVRAGLQRLGGDDVLHARLEIALGHTAFVRTEMDPAPHFERALQHLEAAGRARSKAAAFAVSGLAKARFLAGDIAGADATWLRADAILADHVAPEHPLRTSVSINRIAVTATMGRFGQAAQMQREQLALAQAEREPTDPLLSPLERNLAHMLIRAGRTMDALVLARRTLARDEAAFGRDDLHVAEDHALLASILRLTGDDAQAWTHAHRAWVIFEVTQPDAPAAIGCLIDLAMLEKLADRPDAARTWLRQAARWAPDDFDVQTLLASLHAKEGEGKKARASLEQELERIGYRSDRPNPRYAEPALSLADVLMQEGAYEDARALLGPLVEAMEAGGVRGSTWARAAFARLRCDEALGRSVSPDIAERARDETLADLGPKADVERYEAWLRQR